MDNYNLSNLPLLGDSPDSGERHPWLTDEKNRRATFSRWSATVSTPKQAEQQQLPSTGDGQISGQKVLADFDISLPSSTHDRAKFDESEDAFASLAAYRPLTFDDTQHPFVSELGLGPLEGFTAEHFTDLADEDIADVVLAEPQGIKVLEQPQGESDAAGVIIPESATADIASDKRSDKRSGKRRASESESSIRESIDPHFDDSIRRFGRLPQKNQKLGTDDTEFLLIPRAIATRHRFGAMPEKSADSQKNTQQNPDESLKERVKKETAKWVVRLERGVERRYVCDYPNCGSAYISIGHLNQHIFKHIGISVHKCPYPECSDNPYFRDVFILKRHVKTHHMKKQLYHCKFCDKRFGRSDIYRKHMLAHIQ